MASLNPDISAPSVGALERWAALGVGAALAVYGVNRRSVSGAFFVAASAPLLYRSLIGRWPPILDALAPSDDTRVALGGDRGIHVYDAIRLELPVDEVYAYWRRLENLPRFMTHLESVTDLGNGRSHWVAQGPGMPVEWDAEIINDDTNELIGWRTLEGSDVVSAGSVRFKPTGSGETMVHVHLQYEPPAGKIGATLAWVFGYDPAQTISEDMRRFKALMETGEVPTIEGQPRGRQSILNYD